jgi:hypothetical protein
MYMCVSHIVHFTLLELARTDLIICLARYGVPHACGTSLRRMCLPPMRLITRLVIDGWKKRG